MFLITDRLRSVESRVRRETNQIINGQQVNFIYNLIFCCLPNIFFNFRFVDQSSQAETEITRSYKTLFN